MKFKHSKRDVRERRLAPTLSKTKKGLVLMCPFCKPTHPLLPGEESLCGTSIDVMAKQIILSSYFTRKNQIVCVKCHETSGEMVRYRGGFIHLIDCKPEIKLMPEMPKFSKMAKFIYRLPKGIRSRIEKRTGTVKEIQEITPEGEKTGQVHGYIFWKG